MSVYLWVTPACLPLALPQRTPILTALLGPRNALAAARPYRQWLLVSSGKRSAPAAATINLLFQTSPLPACSSAQSRPAQCSLCSLPHEQTGPERQLFLKHTHKNTLPHSLTHTQTCAHKYSIHTKHTYAYSHTYRPILYSTYTHTYNKPTHTNHNTDIEYKHTHSNLHAICINLTNIMPTHKHMLHPHRDKHTFMFNSLFSHCTL